MRKVVFVIVCVVLIVLLIKVFAPHTSSKYSHSDIVALINKGIQNMDNMNNVSFDKENENGTVHYYFKGNKRKMVSQNIVSLILEDGKNYIISKEEKMIFVKPSPEVDIKSVQIDALRIEYLNDDVRYKDEFRYEFVYIRDEKIENKDCIFVKECVYYLNSKKYVDNEYNSKGEVPVYWIEKSTGFVIGCALMENGTNEAKPQTIIKNIKCGEVADNIFELPSDYNMYDLYTGKEIKVK